MSKPLIVVESPTKVRTLKKYLGNQYALAATVGHIKDLPKKKLGIEIDDGFKPNYLTIPEKKSTVAQLRKAAGNAPDVFIASDPDREGEAIAWHTAEILKKKGRRFHRILFNAFTETDIKRALSKPLELNADKYEAQKTRRIVDRLVGYQISPLLWRKVQRGLSAGRVQSVAVRIICERERAIQAFEPQEYWSITAQLAGDTPPPFAAKLARQHGKKILIGNQSEAQAILDALAGQPFVLKKIARRTVRRQPQPPFITSKLQQEAIHKLKFTARKTMQIAQQLYEGVDLGPGEPEGLITYMRTDSTRIAGEAAQQALAFIHQRFGPDYAESKPRFFKNRNKAQDAHEAIRPTDVNHTPEALAPFLTKDQLALYKLIWRRFVASQMRPAQIDNKTLTIRAARFDFTASGSTVRFAGFMALYMSVDEASERASEDSKVQLPEIAEGQALNLLELMPKQHFTQPPPRFSEASLVKELEENGIGRPSTYAAILSTIRSKGYVEMVKKSFRPTELGFIVTELLVGSFPDLIGVDFTANMETDLDRIESAQVDAQEILSRFYDRFQHDLDAAGQQMITMKGVGLKTDLQCPDCKTGHLHIKVGRNGPFLACSNYPDCRYTSNYERNEKGAVVALRAQEEALATDEICEKCNRPMQVKSGPHGTFLGCSGYPECKQTRSLQSNGNGREVGVACPRSGCEGQIVARSSKRGKIFYGCNQYPKCDFASWDKPVDMACPLCGAPFLVEKQSKKKGRFHACANRECGYQSEPLAD